MGWGSSRHHYSTSLDHMTAQVRHLIEQVHSFTQSHIDQNVDTQAGHYIFTVAILPAL